MPPAPRHHLAKTRRSALRPGGLGHADGWPAIVASLPARVGWRGLRRRGLVDRNNYVHGRSAGSRGVHVFAIWAPPADRCSMHSGSWSGSAWRSDTVSHSRHFWLASRFSKWVLLLAAQRPDHAGPIEQPFPPATNTRRFAVSWPSSFGDRLTEFEDPEPRHHRFGDRNLVREHVAGLVQDWLSGNGWKYRLVGVWLPGPGRLARSVPCRNGGRCIRSPSKIRTDLSSTVGSRFGDGKVTFRFETVELHQRFHIDPSEVSRPEQDFPPEPIPALVGPDPLWDRWLDP